ncbi:hypothetical protein PMKS-002243 [Pichia membranifaciens]|uniref:CMP/dCMP-type deaminase domain-containing protein n=1 Tax=Pichia membranifaciens TaxID=4926 RepID=A0A1Q2YGW6_9ASCO|nr:hypothetical protein PMKS-002243 [Pichia membranifaciens]
MDASDHFKFMQESLKYGEVALNHDEVPVAAILVDNSTKKILYRAHNMTNITLNGTAHAEFRIYDYLKRTFPKDHLQMWQNCTLYVTVEPCIIFGGNGSVFDIRYKSNIKLVPGVGHREAISLLRRFYIRENERSPQNINKKKRTLKLDEFPQFRYSQFITLQEFIDIWGKEYQQIYAENDFLQFGEDGKLKLPCETVTNKKRLKT